MPTKKPKAPRAWNSTLPQPEQRMKVSPPKPRATAIKKVNPKRRKKAHAKGFGPEGYMDFLKSYGCIVARERDGDTSDCEGPIDMAHVRSRAAGGTWKETTPLCRKHHGIQHRHGIKSFEVKYQTDLDFWAVAIYSRWLGITQSKEPV